MPSLQFKGKTFVQNHHLAVPYHQLVPQPDKSLTDKVSLNDNLIIHGDNLIALKSLLPTYAGKVKCIYIDPPYNTGNENWIYNDNVNGPIIKEWIGKVVGKEDEDFVRHDKWLCMMMPRLKLLRELLRDNGSIFISIDDNEFHHLRSLMNEIFGEENFIATIIWQKMDSPKNSAIHFSEDHDYIMVYAKDKNVWKPNMLSRTEQMLARYKNPDNDPRGKWLLSDMAARNSYSEGRYSITTPTGRVIDGPPAGSYWRISRDKFEELKRDGRIWWGSTGNNRPGIKRFLSEVQEGIVPQTLWFWKDVGSTRNAKQELSKIMSANASEDLFITPKPSGLIDRILQIASGPNDLIIDSFAGSGVTAQAVLAMNKKDGGNRKFVLVECEDYADSLTAERVRRVIKGVPNSNNELLKHGLGATFSYLEIGSAIEMESLLKGRSMPSYLELARFLFYTATGDEFKETNLDEMKHFIGRTDKFDVYVYYKPNIDYLKTTALTLDEARRLRTEASGKPLLVFAPTKYIDQTELDNLNITFCQLPYEIYRLK